MGSGLQLYNFSRKRDLLTQKLYNWRPDPFAIFGRRGQVGTLTMAGMARIAIIGPGAIGCAIAAGLEAVPGHEIFLCARRPLSGLTVERTPGGPVALGSKVL